MVQPPREDNRSSREKERCALDEGYPGAWRPSGPLCAFRWHQAIYRPWLRMSQLVSRGIWTFLKLQISDADDRSRKLKTGWGPCVNTGPYQDVSAVLKPHWEYLLAKLGVEPRTRQVGVGLPSDVNFRAAFCLRIRPYSIPPSTCAASTFVQFAFADLEFRELNADDGWV